MLQCSIFSENGFFERSVPVWLAYSANASMINWRLELGVVVWPVDDMTTMGGLFLQRGWEWGGRTGLKGHRLGRPEGQCHIRRLCKAVQLASCGDHEGGMRPYANLHASGELATVSWTTVRDAPLNELDINRRIASQETPPIHFKFHLIVVYRWRSPLSMSL